MGRSVPTENFTKLTAQEAVYLLQLGHPAQASDPGSEVQLEVLSPDVPVKGLPDEVLLMTAGRLIDEIYEKNGIRRQAAKQARDIRDGGKWDTNKFHAYDYFAMSEIESIAGMSWDEAQKQPRPKQKKKSPRTK